MREQLERHRDRLTSHISNEVALRSATWNADPGFKEFLSQELTKYVTNGKLVRGCLVLDLTKLLGRKELVYPAACAVEFVHSALLMQDDIMDGDMLRRGLPSMHVQFENNARTSHFSHTSRYGESQAIALADILIFWSVDLFAQSCSTLNQSHNLFSILADKYSRVGLGQMLDVKLAHNPAESSSRYIEEMLILKTAEYTFSLPLQMAAAFNDRADLMTDFNAIGRHLGLIFQLIDDQFAYTLASSKVGKDVASDIVANKKTLQRHLIFERADTQYSDILSYYGSPSLTIEQLKAVQRAAQELQVVSEIEAMIKYHSKQASELISQLPLPAVQSYLWEVLTYLETRTK